MKLKKTISIDELLFNQITEYGKIHNRSVSNVIDIALHEFFKNRENDNERE